MKIAHVVTTSTPANIQGNERHVIYLAGMQRARGMNVAVVTNSNGLFFDLCEQDGIPVFVVGDAPGAAVSVKGILAKVKEVSPEIIHCHDLLTGMAVVTAANKFNAPCVITLHDAGADQIIYDLITAGRTGLKFTLIAVCKSEFEVMQKSGMANLNFHYVPNGTRAPSDARYRERGKACRPNLILVGNLGFRKGIDLAILAMVELHRRRGPDCPVLNIYGEGEMDEYFTEMTKILDVRDVVKFHGIQMDVLDKCPISDVLIVPSRFETGPLVVLEAMSRGMPIVACDVGEVAEMLPDRRYGYVVPVNSIRTFADAMDSILTDIASGEFNAALLVERHQSQYSIDRMADRISAVYQSAIATSNEA
jgi:glycosyltransferase involved in cell wall biosynthesis